MYTPSAFEEKRITNLLALIREAPLGTLVVAGNSRLEVNHLPCVYDGNEAGQGTLRAHIPRANPLTGMLNTATPAVVVFHGADGYVSPSWYATKQAHGKVVPTWNYAVAHVHGPAQVVDDAAWIRDQLEQLTDQSEQVRAEPWSVSDAPSEFTDKLIAALIGVEIVIERLEGKVKASQNQPAENQRSILTALAREPVNTEFSRLMTDRLS